MVETGKGMVEHFLDYSHTGTAKEMNHSTEAGRVENSRLTHHTLYTGEQISRCGMG